jgi:CDP-glycerol glycerophosphotransferase (TagB/SpsB family)
MNISNMLFGKEWNELKSFENLSESQRTIVFYAENKASINHFNSLINELTKNMNLDICYVTSVKDDPIHENLNPKIRSFYIGDGTVRTKFFLGLKAKILIMDMPDLETYHIKRSKIHAVHYIYIFHSIFSVHSYLRKGAIDNYDTIFCVGPHHKNEIRETEKIYNLKAKNLISFGFPRLDTLLNEKQNYSKISDIDDNLILLTPSYGKNNLLEICGFELIKILLESNFKVLLRPHFKILKDSKKLISKILDEFGNNPNFSLEHGVIPSKLFHSSICMISDWSGISFEYAFTFERPVIFIDVPKKILNLNFHDISLEPIEISYRDKIGFVVSPNELKTIPDLIYNLKNNNLSTIELIKEIRSKTIFNIGQSAIIGAQYIQKLTKDL